MKCIFQEQPLTQYETVRSYILDNGNIILISNGKVIDEKHFNDCIDKFNFKPNLYVLYIKKSADTKWQIRYIGQRKSDGIKQRLREHLIYCNPKTGSKYSKVQDALADGYEIGIKLLRITDLDDTEHIRLTYETKLIEEFRTQLTWNKKQQ